MNISGSTSCSVQLANAPPSSGAQLELEAMHIDALPAELLGHIFTLLPTRDLLRASHVSRGWRKASATSIKLACLQDGLELPKSGVNNHWALRAQFEKIKSNWESDFFYRPPSYIVVSPTKNRAPWCLPKEALQVTKHGVLCRGKENNIIDLPLVGDDSLPSCELLKIKPTQDIGQGCLRLAESRSFVLLEYAVALSHSYTISLCRGEDELIRDSVQQVPTMATCASACVSRLVTGHADGIRLWGLPGLTFVSHIERGHPVRKVLLSNDGALMAFEEQPLVSCGGEWLDAWYVLNLQSGRTKPVGKADFAFMSNRLEQVTFIGQENIGHQAGMIFSSYNPSGERISQSIVDSSFDTVTFSEPHRSYLALGSVNCAYFISVDDPTVTREMALPFFASDMQSLAVSSDGRWVVALQGCGDVWLWDLSNLQSIGAEFDNVA